MKQIFLLLFIFSIAANAQSLYKPRANSVVSYRNGEDFKISFTKTLNSYIYKPNDRLLNPNLKQKIESFMNTTKFVQYRGVGKFTLNIIKRKNDYYIVQQKFPERLILL